MDTEKKKTIIAKYRIGESDTGSVEVQIAVLTERINELTTHLKANPRDFHSQRGLFKLIGHRRRLLSYLNRHDFSGYQSIIERLGLRK